MGKKVRKTEHAGPKKGRGAFYGRKKMAKLMSTRTAGGRETFDRDPDDG
jgi:hypothetical protein